MREREVLRRWRESERLKQLRRAEQIEAEREMKGSIFRVARMLLLHEIFGALFGRKK